MVIERGVSDVQGMSRSKIELGVSDVQGMSWS